MSEPAQSNVNDNAPPDDISTSIKSLEARIKSLEKERVKTATVLDIMQEKVQILFKITLS
jgi:hypothetical protein